MIKGNQQIKLIDFGAACLFDHEGMTDCVGTLIYQAPEVLSRQAKYHESADMWQIGIVTYALLSGHFPYNYRVNPSVDS
jgi:serine/threonine protein kinase